MRPLAPPPAGPRPVKGLASSILVLIPLSALHVATPLPAGAQDVEDRIEEIRDLYGQVEASLETYEMARKDYVHPGGGGVVETYRDDGVLRKLVGTLHGDGFSLRTEYFFHDDALFFVFERAESFPIWPDQDPDDYGPTERRLYFDGPRLVRLFERSHQNDMVDEPVPPGSERFRAQEEEALEDARLWRAFAASKEENFSVFRDSWTGGGGGG